MNVRAALAYGCGGSGARVAQAVTAQRLRGKTSERTLLLYNQLSTPRIVGAIPLCHVHEWSGHWTGTAIPLWTGTAILVCLVCLLKAALGQHTADTRSRCSGVRNLWQGRRGCDDERLFFLISNHSAGGAGVSHGRKRTQSGVAPPAAQATSFISPASIFSSDHFRGRAIACVKAPVAGEWQVTTFNPDAPASRWAERMYLAAELATSLGQYQKHDPKRCWAQVAVDACFGGADSWNGILVRASGV